MKIANSIHRQIEWFGVLCLLTPASPHKRRTPIPSPQERLWFTDVAKPSLSQMQIFLEPKEKKLSSLHGSFYTSLNVLEWDLFSCQLHKKDLRFHFCLACRKRKASTREGIAQILLSVCCWSHFWIHVLVSSCSVCLSTWSPLSWSKHLGDQKIVVFFRNKTQINLSREHMFESEMTMYIQLFNTRDVWHAAAQKIGR